MAVVRLLICDDSNLARKLLVRALPRDWAVVVTEAANGQQGLEAIRSGNGEIVLLDLTMPVMDGYQVLQAVQTEGHPSRIIVVSGDVQDEAVRRVMDLGALAFIKKPVSSEDLLATLVRLRILDQPLVGVLPISTDTPAKLQISFQEVLREVVNVAMGQAAALMARVLDVFVKLPVPHVSVLEVGELHMILMDTASQTQMTAICQSFIGSGIAGEVLLIFHDCDVADLGRLMKHELNHVYSDGEMLLDLAALLAGACLSGIAEQADVYFAQSHPQQLGLHGTVEEFINRTRPHWRPNLTVEICYALEDHLIHFDLLLLFTEDSVELLRKKLAYAMNDYAF